mgnify:CR=1 FL=1
MSPGGILGRRTGCLLNSWSIVASSPNLVPPGVLVFNLGLEII